MCACEREGEIDRECVRKRERETERENKREKEKEKEKKNERGRERKRERGRERKKERKRERERKEGRMLNYFFFFKNITNCCSNTAMNVFVNRVYSHICIYRTLGYSTLQPFLMAVTRLLFLLY